MLKLENLRTVIRRNHMRDEFEIINELVANAGMSEDFHMRAEKRGAQLVQEIRSDRKPSLMEVFLAEYGLSTDEGVALMCLAEALLRVPDSETIDELIEDKIAPSEWGAHLGKSSSPLVNASTWALMLTGKVLREDENEKNSMASLLRSAVRRVGEPVIRTAVSRAMKELGAQFVLGETIEAAVSRGRKRQAQGYTFSYDMLGEAALTASDATDYFDAYANAISKLASECTSDDIRKNPGISIKLSALHERYEVAQRDRVMTELVERTLILAKQARDAGMGLNIDAEEADRLDLSLDVIEAILSDEALAGWDGFGVVVQAYGKRSAYVLDWLYALAEKLDRKIMVRLVKGAYWDTEIKRVQVEGLEGFPVFTQKSATDVCYICCAQKLLGMTDRIYPQFATHNAHSVAAIIEMDAAPDVFEFQRLHGMGESLHDLVISKNKYRCRIYAPVGAHEDLLAYLVRRLLENGANSSFVNQIVDENVPASVVAADPFKKVDPDLETVCHPDDLYGDERRNSHGFNVRNTDDLELIENARGPFKNQQWHLKPVIVAKKASGETVTVKNPSLPDDTVGTIQFCTAKDVDKAIASAAIWTASPQERAAVLNKAGDLYEEHFGELFALLAREAGKTALDAIAELREAVDFLRYYAARALELKNPPRGTITCISPWNFPLAIFTGQLSAALAAGNSVLAKPAETTSLVAVRATQLLHEAGVPASALQLLPGEGRTIGAALTGHKDINGVCFTGSTATAQSINRNMAENMSPSAPLIAETGGLNAMIVDSTALPEQAIRDIVASAFQSAGQRCSALRVLYLQDDIADSFLKMLYGTMDAQVVADPWEFKADLGPVIDEKAKATIEAHIETARSEGRLLKQITCPEVGIFVAPAVLSLSSILDLKQEIFGPVLHVVRFHANELDQVLRDINATGFGLTCGLHSRIDDRVEYVTQRLNIGNMYVNRNQIGAVVGTQPFGGEGLSGTGPKAGGPYYVPRFAMADAMTLSAPQAQFVDVNEVQALLDRAKTTGQSLKALNLPGPTGESNILSIYGRGKVLCLGPTREAALAQKKIAEDNGCAAICIALDLERDEGLNGSLEASALAALNGFDAVVSFAENDVLQAYRKVLAERDGAILPLINDQNFADRIHLERHICIDTTAAGGNASLLASV
ncbi:bifunctional proline dehydrogenase/L-glutamate gamma-semialdehyde dehydrogenase PutA [Ahrensia kielensis]|uniref:Bifunctional protein PutA n=1 Tax=Ahrensia kielensis TaxID=76980 RepID=A0ABU9T211_9HYPH